MSHFDNENTFILLNKRSYLLIFDRSKSKTWKEVNKMCCFVIEISFCLLNDRCNLLRSKTLKELKRVYCFVDENSFIYYSDLLRVERSRSRTCFVNENSFKFIIRTNQLF